MPTGPDHHAPNHRTTGRPALIERAREAHIYAEISARLIELHEGHAMDCPTPAGRSPLTWLLKAARLGAESPPALWLYLRLQSGDTADLSATYAELAAKTYRARQTVQIELSETCALLATHYPELARVVNELRATFRETTNVGAQTYGLATRLHQRGRPADE